VNHYRKTVKVYRKRRKSQKCPFCDPETLAKAIYQNDRIYVVPNLTQYDLWESFDVKDHLLIVPKRHVVKLPELDDKEKLAIMQVAAGYEAEGYSIYARGVGFVNRSVEHQHTHLIKVSNKQPKVMLYLNRPYYYLFKK